MTIAARRLTSVALALATLGACSQSNTDPGPGAVSAGEAEALEQAAKMLEEQRMPAEAEAALTSTEEGPQPPADE